MTKTHRNQIMPFPILRALLLAACLSFVAAGSLAQDDDAMQAMGEYFASGSGDWESHGCTLPVWHQGSPSRVILVPPDYADYGINAGDYIVAVNDTPFPANSSEQIELLSQLPTDAEVRVEVERAGERVMTDVRCASAADFSRYMRMLTQSLLDSDAENCVHAVNKLEDALGGAVSMEIWQSRLVCQAYADPLGFQDNQARFQSEYIGMMIDRLQYSADQFAAARPEIVNGIAQLSEAKEYALAAALKRKLIDAEAFMENDGPPPDLY